MPTPYPASLFRHSSISQPRLESSTTLLNSSPDPFPTHHASPTFSADSLHPSLQSDRTHCTHTPILKPTQWQITSHASISSLSHSPGLSIPSLLPPPPPPQQHATSSSFSIHNFASKSTKSKSCKRNKRRRKKQLKIKEQLAHLKLLLSSQSDVQPTSELPQRVSTRRYGCPASNLS